MSSAVFLEGASRPDAQGATTLHHRSIAGAIGEPTIPRSRSIDGVFGLFKSMPAPPSTKTNQGQRVPSEPSAVHTPPTVGSAKRAVGGGRRRARTNYTPEQLSGLDDLFAKTQYPGIDEREALADSVDLSEARIQVWFQNRRARLRRKERQSPEPATKAPAVPPKPTSKRSKPSPSSRPSSPGSSPSSSSTPPTASLESAVTSPRSPHYLEVCTGACCAPSVHRQQQFMHQAGAQYLTGAKSYYPWAALSAFQQGYPYYLYPEASPFYYATAPYPAVSIQELTNGRDSTVSAPASHHL